jgi:primary-amine oxidase
LTHYSVTILLPGAFANYHLWVTPHDDNERFPSGEYTVQGTGSDGLPDWTAANRNIKGEDIVLWHAFGVTHVPRPEDFPVMPCEITGVSCHTAFPIILLIVLLLMHTFPLSTSLP